MRVGKQPCAPSALIYSQQKASVKFIFLLAAEVVGRCLLSGFEIYYFLMATSTKRLNFLLCANTTCSKTIHSNRDANANAREQKSQMMWALLKRASLGAASLPFMHSALSAFENKSSSFASLCDNEPSGSQVLTLEIWVKPWIKADKYFSLLSLVAVESLSLLQLRSQIGISSFSARSVSVPLLLFVFHIQHCVLTDRIVSCASVSLRGPLNDDSLAFNDTGRGWRGLFESGDRD